MRCLNTTGWLHNRLRMVVASYLTRILNISWRHGESWFAQHLFDYDATQNHFGWKGQASLSKDGTDYFRVINPYTQAKKYDSETQFIKQWIPEFKNCSPKEILSWENKQSLHNNVYIEPLIKDHTEKAKDSIKTWKQSRN